MRAVARRFAVSFSVVSRSWRRYQETGQYIRRRGGALQNDPQRATNVHVRNLTVRNSLREGGMRARRPQVEVVLTAQHCAAHLVSLHDRFGSVSVMVWGGISLGGHTALHALSRGSLTAIRYRHEILRLLVRPYAGAVGTGFFVMQDNTRPHVTGVCQQFLQDKGNDGMDWPACSPDLNPIEHIWDMSRSVHQRHVAPQTVPELADAVVLVWEEISQETIHHLIRSMSRRCREVIRAHGGHTHY
uniref:Tc1-like transposase DDE domain-containing protein n=1 Tax=Denticeps clupeoides TaxID=299321 RepID=A0AAY4AUI7_9TELE